MFTVGYVRTVRASGRQGGIIGRMASSRDGVAAGGLEIRRKGTIKIVGLGWDYEGREIMSFYFII